MALSSIEYKERLVEFGRDLSQVADNLYEAIEDELPPARREAVIAAAQKKVQDYSAFLEELKTPQKAELERKYGSRVRDIEGWLDTLLKR